MSKNFAKDWWKRKEEDAYSFYDSSKKLFDWDSGRSGYASYFLRDNQNLKSAAKMVGSMFRVIGVPKTMKYEHTHTSKSESDANRVTVPLNMLRDEKGEYLNHNTELLDAFYGASIQNAALATMQTAKEYARTARARSADSKTTPKDLLYTLLNTERIDKKLADRFPGYSKFVQKFKNYKYNTTYEPLAPEEHEGKRLLELVTKFIRYPGNITEEEMEEFAKPIEQIEKYMKKNGFPRTSDDCDRQASYMYGVVQKYIKEEEQKKEEDPSGGGSGGPSSEDMEELAKQLMQQMVNAEDGDGSEELENDFGDFKEDMEEKKNLPPSNHDFNKTGEYVDGNVKFIKAEKNKERYMKDLKKIDTCKSSVLAKLFARKCKDYQFSMKSMRSGRLDTNKIAEAAQNVPTIYERFGQVYTNKLNIGVLIDESGSMGSYDKMEKARQAAIFMNEVFKKVPDVRMYIYGHTADSNSDYGTCFIRTYKEHGKGNDPHLLGSAKARHNNRDGDAIYAVARKIRQQNSDPCLLFVISDGAPYAMNYSGQQAINDTKKKVQMAQALGFQVIQIAIEAEVPSEEMFDYHIQLTDIKNLPLDLINYVSKKVDKLIKAKTII